MIVKTKKARQMNIEKSEGSGKYISPEIIQIELHSSESILDASVGFNLDDPTEEIA